MLAPEAPEEAFLDYAFLRNRVMEEHGWDGERAEGALREYLRFLRMLAEAPREELVASSDVDLVWHEHLVDTKNYAKDCIRLFGHFLHHRRARTQEELAEIPASYALTKRVYASRYGADPPARFWGPATEAASMCGGGSNLDPSDTGLPTGNTQSTIAPTTSTGNTQSTIAPTTSTGLVGQQIEVAAAPRSARPPATLLAALLIAAAAGVAGAAVPSPLLGCIAA